MNKHDIGFDPMEHEVMSGKVKARMRFLDACEGKPTAYGRQRVKDYLPLVDCEVEIEDARVAADAFDLDVHGFRLINAPTRMRNFLDGAALRQTYLPELEKLVLELTGADKAIALASSVVRRSERSVGYLEPGTSVPGRYVHCDYSPGPMGSLYWLDRALDPEEATWRRTRRFAIFNVWRAISEPPHDTPLALCDVRSLRPGDRAAADCVCDPEGEPEWRFENSLYHYGAHQRWLWFSDMGPDEALVFKGYESDPAYAEGVPHAAFDNPSCPPDAPPRESIDERIIAFF